LPATILNKEDYVQIINLGCLLMFFWPSSRHMKKTKS